MDEAQQQQIETIRQNIANLEEALYQQRLWRAAKIVIMDKTMTRREIGEAWGISNVMVTKIVNQWKRGTR